MEDELKHEAIERMKILKLSNQIIDDYKANNDLYICNVRNNIQKVSTTERSIVDKIEQDYNVKVYYLVQYQNLLYFLYIKDNQEEWEQEKQNLKNGYAEVIYIVKANGTVGLLTDETTGIITKVIEC